MRFRATTWTRLARNLRLLSTKDLSQSYAPGPKLQHEHVNPVLPVLSSTSGTETARYSRTLNRRYPLARSRQELNIDPNSLRNTLDAHRDANRASLIVKVAGKGSDREPLDLLEPVKQAEQHERTKNVPRVRRLVLMTRKDVRRQKKRAGTTQPSEKLFLAQWAPNNRLRGSQRYPWMRHIQQSGQSVTAGRLTGIEQLNVEIDAFYSYSQLTLPEQKAAELAIQDISAAIRQVDENARINIVGSRATGLALPMSDIDINISNSSTNGSRQLVQSLLRKVATSLSTPHRGKKLFRSLITRFRPKIQLVTGRHASTHLEFQVQSTIDAMISMEQTMSFINEYPTLAKLFILIKQMLAMRGLNVGSQQGVSSYPLLIMIVAALKFSEGKLDRHNAGAQLLFFLDMYSDIDFTTTAISFSPLQYVVKRHPQSTSLPLPSSAAPAPDAVTPRSHGVADVPGNLDARRRFATLKPDAEHLMCLQDPANLLNDLGRAAYRIREVQATFIRSRAKLKASLKAWDDGDGSEKPSPLLASCVDGDYRIYESMRQELGASVGYRLKEKTLLS